MVRCNKEKAATGPPEKDVALPGVEPTEPDTAPQRLPQPEPEPEAEPAKTIIEPADVGGEAAKLIAECNGILTPAEPSPHEINLT